MVDKFDQKGIQKLILESGATLEINYGKLLGQGTFGAVFSGKYSSADGKNFDNNVAIKVPLDEGNREDLSKETKMNFIQGILYEQSTVENTLYIVMPNLGEPLPNALAAGQNLTDPILPDESSISDSINDSTLPPTDKKSVDFKHNEENALDSGTFVINDEEVSIDSGTFVINDDEVSIDSGTFVVNDDEASIDSGTVVINDDDTNLDSGTVLIKDDESSFDSGTVVFNSGTFVENSENSNEFGTFLQKDNSIPSTDKKAGFFNAIASAADKADNNILTREKKSFLEEIPPKPLKILDLNVNNYNLRLNETVDIFEKMAAEVEKAHSNGILHLDIKGENFIRNKETGEVKLIDFGVSEFIADNEEKDIRGSLAWIPPELILQKTSGAFTTEQDVYSLGRTYIMTLAGPLAALNKESITVDTPIPITNMNFLVRKGFRELQDDLPQLENIQFKSGENIPEISVLNKLISVMNGMTELNPANRPSISEVRQLFKSMQSELKQLEDKKYLEILEDIPFHGNKLAARVMAQNAIREFNQQHELQWHRQQIDKRQPEPFSLEMPENTRLDALIATIRNKQTEKIEGKKQTQNVQHESQQINNPNNMQSEIREVRSSLLLNFKNTVHPKKFTLVHNDPHGVQNKQDASIENKSDAFLQDVNSLIAKMNEDVKKYHQKSVNKNNHQRLGGFKSFMVKFQGDNTAAVQLSAKLIYELQRLADSRDLSADAKINLLKSELQNALNQHRENHKTALSKGENSDFHKICKTGIDHITKLQNHDTLKVSHKKT